MLGGCELGLIHTGCERYPSGFLGEGLCTLQEEVYHQGGRVVVIGAGAHRCPRLVVAETCHHALTELGLQQIAGRLQLLYTQPQPAVLVQLARGAPGRDNVEHLVDLADKV